MGADGSIGVMTIISDSNGFSMKKYVSGSWGTLDGTAAYISVGNNINDFVVVNRGGDFWRYTGSFELLFNGAIDAGLNNGHLWGTSTTNASGGKLIFKWDGSK
jgi:hypothetical protein